MRPLSAQAPALPEVRASLRAAAQQLYDARVPVDWRYPLEPAEDPVARAIDPRWPLFAQATYPHGADREHWAYAELTFPAALAGIPLAGTEAGFRVSGCVPFTLWADGVEVFAEEQPWASTGPVLGAFPFGLQPGVPHRLVMRIRPPTWFAMMGANFFSLETRFAACHEAATDIAAAEAQLGLAAELAAGAEEAALVERAARAVDLAALEQRDLPKLRASFAAMEAVLQPLAPKAKAITVHAIGHTHIDMEFWWTWDETIAVVRRDLRGATELMRDHPEVALSHSQVPAYLAVQEHDPRVFTDIRQRIAEGRWECVAATWVEGDLNLADGESLAHQLLYASAWCSRELGAAARVFWAPDTFGHPANLPQFARLGGCDGYFHCRGSPADGDPWEPVRNWEGLDGSSVTAVRAGYAGTLRPSAIAGAASAAHARGRRTGSLVWGVGDHGGGLERRELRALERFRDRPLIPHLRFSTMGALIDAARSEPVPLPVARGETHTMFDGCFTTHARMKQLHRRCEGELVSSGALAAMAGLDRRAALREGWLPTLFNQFHDILCGAAIAPVYANASARAERSLAAAAGIAADALARLLRPAERGRIALVNPTGFARTEPVRVRLPPGTRSVMDERGRIQPVQRLGDEHVFIASEVPAFAVVHYQALDQPPPGSLPELASAAADGDGFFAIRTEHAAIRLNARNGVIGSWRDHRLGRELVAFGVPKPTMGRDSAARADLGLNLFQVIDESPTEMNAWFIKDILREESLVRGARVALIDSGPVFARFQVEHAFRASAIREEVVFYRSFPRADFTAAIDWHERGSERAGIPQLKVAFAADIPRPAARFEGPYGVVERPANGVEQPTQKFLDVSGPDAGFTLYNDARYGCDVLGPRARITLVRNAFAPDPETDNGLHTVRFAFAPHAGSVPSAQLVRDGIAFNRPLLARPGCERAVTPPQLRIAGGASVVCTALRQAEHADELLLRLVECDGVACEAEVAYGAMDQAREVDLLERQTGGDALRAGAAALRFRPHEIKTLAFVPAPGHA